MFYTSLNHEIIFSIVYHLQSRTTASERNKFSHPYFFNNWLSNTNEIYIVLKLFIVYNIHKVLKYAISKKACAESKMLNIQLKYRLFSAK